MGTATEGTLDVRTIVHRILHNTRGHRRNLRCHMGGIPPWTDARKEHPKLGAWLPVRNSRTGGQVSESGSGARRSACSSSCASTRVPVPVYRQPVSPFVEGELLEVIIEPSQFLRVRADLGKVL
jgi:hypothetical protein